jgi:DNA-binding transcriptional LysR family regulator
MELRHLRYFVAVAEELHFGRAARRLLISQPPLSQQIRRLEAEVGAPLFHRSRRGVELTGAGEALLPEARRTIEQSERALETARQGAQEPAPHIELGFVSSASFLLADLLPRLRRDAPSLSIGLREGSTSQQVEMLRTGVLSLGILRAPVVGTGIATRTIVAEPLLVALPGDHPLADRPSLALRDLAEQPFVLFDRHLGHALFDQITGACRAAGFIPDVVQSTSSLVTVAHLVGAGVGVSIVPASVAHPAPGVRFRTAVDLDARVDLDLAWRAEADEREPDAVRLVAAAAVAATARLVPG